MGAPSEFLGRVVGALLAPFTGGVAKLRHARTFHPDGLVFRATLTPSATEPALRAVAERLEGPALARLSPALWRGGREWPDALGLAVRLRDAPLEVSPSPGPDDQDLLFATIRSPWTTPFSPLSTDARDFLANDYYAVSPFQVRGLPHQVKWRLVSARPQVQAPTRAERLRGAVAQGRAHFELELRQLGLRQPYRRVATVRLEAEVAIDQQALRFWPHRAGRGIEPRGFVHALRPFTYGASQTMRSSP